MATRAVGPLAGIGWLRNAVNLGRHNPRAIFGGAGLILLLALVPSAITVPLQLTMTPGPAMLATIMAVSLLAGILLVPLIGGYFRVIDATEHGQGAKATDVFAAYRRNGDALRLIGFGLGMLVLYVIALAAIAGAAGADVLTWYMQVLAATSPDAAAGNPTALPPLPEGLGLAVVLGCALGLLLSGVYAIGFGQAAISRRTAAGAIADGMVGSFKNLLPLLVLALVGLLAMLALGLLMLVLAALLGLLAKAAGLWLMIVLMVPIYIALLVTIYVVVFGAMYYLWRDVCDDGSAREASAAALTA